MDERDGGGEYPTGAYGGGGADAIAVRYCCTRSPVRGTMARMQSMRYVLMLGMAFALAACDGGGSATSSSAPPAASSSAKAAPKASERVNPAPAPSPSHVDAAPAAPSAAAAAAIAPGKDRGVVTVDALLEGWKKEPTAWVNSTVKIKGSVQSYTENTFTLDAQGLHGPDKAGTYFGVYLVDPGAKGNADTTGCFLEEGKSLEEVRAAFKKYDNIKEEVIVEMSGPIEATFGNVAPCKITSVSIAKRKKK